MDNYKPLSTYTTYVKCVLGLGGGGGEGGGEGVVQAKEDIKQLPKIDHLARWWFLLYINYINIYTLL